MSINRAGLEEGSYEYYLNQYKCEDSGAPYGNSFMFFAGWGFLWLYLRNFESELSVLWLMPCSICLILTAAAEKVNGMKYGYAFASAGAVSLYSWANFELVGLNGMRNPLALVAFLIGVSFCFLRNPETPEERARKAAEFMRKNNEELSRFMEQRKQSARLDAELAAERYWPPEAPGIEPGFASPLDRSRSEK